MTQVDLTGLTLTYPGVPAPSVDGVTLRVKSGSMTAVLGPSGCGKTTVMKLIAGLLDPDAGDISFDGKSILSTRPERRGAVMVFQNALLFPQQTVAENVGFGLRMRGIARPEIDARVDDMLARVQLSDLGSRKPASLSGGQQQRVALARALVVRPKVLLLDEPLSNLDAHLRSDMRALIVSLHRETGVTTLLVTHDQQEAVIVADQIALMLGGRLIQHAAPQDMFRKPASLAAARFFGARNVIAGTVRDGDFLSPLGVLALEHGAKSGPATVTIRPEAIGIGAGDSNTLSGRVDSNQFLGTQSLLVVRIGSLTLEVLTSPDQARAYAVGDPVTLHVPRHAIWMLPDEAEASAHD